MPHCAGCKRIGLKCEYGRPVWWYDDTLKAEQREINKRLIKNHKTRLGTTKKLNAQAQRKRRTGHDSSRGSNQVRYVPRSGETFTYIISARLKSLPPPFNNQGRARQLFPPQARSHNANLIRSKLSSEKRMRQHLVPRLHKPCKKVMKICTMPRLHQERMLGLTLLLPNLMVLCIPWRSQTNGFVDLHDQGLLLQLQQTWRHGRRLMAGDMILKSRDLIGLEVVGGGSSCVDAVCSFESAKHLFIFSQRI
jgi:hypothetical protein